MTPLTSEQRISLVEQRLVQLVAKVAELDREYNGVWCDIEDCSIELRLVRADLAKPDVVA